MSNEKQITPTVQPSQLDEAYNNTGLTLQRFANEVCKFRKKNDSESVLTYFQALQKFLSENKKQNTDKLSILESLSETISTIESLYKKSSQETDIAAKNKDIGSIKQHLIAINKFLERIFSELDKQNTLKKIEDYFNSGINVLSNDPEALDSLVKESNLFLQEQKNTEATQDEKSDLSSFLKILQNQDKVDLADPRTDGDGKRLVTINGKPSGFKTWRLDENNRLVLKNGPIVPLTIPQQVIIGAFVFGFGSGLSMAADFKFQSLSAKDGEIDDALFQEKKRLTGAYDAYVVQFLINRAAENTRGVIFSGKTNEFSREFVEELKPLLEMARAPEKEWSSVEIPGQENKLK